MHSHLLSSLLSAIQSFNGNNTGSKLLLGAAGIASMLAMLKAMRKNAKAAKQKMTKAQRKEMRKLKWKMRWAMLKKMFSGDGELSTATKLIIVLVLGGLLFWGFVVIMNWAMATLIIGIPFIYGIVKILSGEW